MEKRPIGGASMHDGVTQPPSDHIDTQIDDSLAEIARKLPLDNVEDVLSRQENEVLEAFAELKELELEQAILRAEGEVDDSMETDDEESALRAAQKELLEARASYHLRQNVFENVLQADPLLKAVHAGANATPSERALHPLIDQRDVLAMCHNTLSTALHEVLDASTLEGAEILQVMEENRILAAEVFQLADQLKEQELDDLQDTALLERLQTSESEAREARRQYRFIKGVVGGVITGSGIDWATDEQWRDLVLDAED